MASHGREQRTDQASNGWSWPAIANNGRVPFRFWGVEFQPGKIGPCPKQKQNMKKRNEKLPRTGLNRKGWSRGIRFILVEPVWVRFPDGLVEQMAGKWSFVRRNGLGRVPTGCKAVKRDPPV